MKTKILFLVVILVVLSCTKLTEVTLEDENEDSVYRIGSESGILGNVDMYLIPETIQGSAIVLINGPGVHVGYDIRKRNDHAFVYFADSYIGKGDISLQAGTQLPLDQWLRVRLVVYESGLAGWIVSLLQSLGMDFFEAVEDYMIEAVYEADIFLSSGQGLKWKNSTQNYKGGLNANISK